MDSRRSLSILYGSETGTAESVAVRLYRESKRYHFHSRVCPMDAYPAAEIVQEELVVFVCSTTGQGDEPENMGRFWRLLLRKRLTADTLAGMKFGVIGLGDSSYPKYNYVGKKLYRRLLQLGGRPLVPLALGDDQHDLGPDAEVDPWIKSFWTKALEEFPLPNGVSPRPAHERPNARYRVALNADKLPAVIVPETKSQSVAGCSEANPFLAHLASNARQTSDDHFQDTRLVEFDVSTSGGGLDYEPGDVCMVMPRNSKENVDSFFELFSSLKREDRMWLEKADSFDLPPQSQLPQGSSIEYCVQHYWDIQSIPRRYFFEMLSHFSRDILEKEKLIEFNTAEGQQDLYDYVNRPRRNILEVLYDFRHTTPNIPLEYLFDLIPPIRPRAFSISSSPSAHAGKIQLLVAVVSFKTKLLVKARLGLCSNFLANCAPGTFVPIWVRKGTMDFGLDKDTGELRGLAICVGPGTGIAPFRSFVSEYAHHLRSRGEGAKILVFFGCRNREKDLYFRDEWEKLAERSGCGVRFFTAFSREQEDKEYVQHVVRREAALVSQFVRDGARVYIAGNAKQMPDQVTQEIARAIGKRGDEAEKFVEEMIRLKRLQMDTWS